MKYLILPINNYFSEPSEIYFPTFSCDPNYDYIILEETETE